MAWPDLSKLNDVAAGAAQKAMEAAQALGESAGELSAAGAQAVAAAGDTLSGAVEAAGKGLDGASKTIASVANDTAGAVAGGVASATEVVTSAVAEARESAEQAAAERERAEREARAIELQLAMDARDEHGAVRFFRLLGESPVAMTRENTDRIKETFPIPVEQHVLWSSAEFDLRPSGIAVTDKGVFIKSDVDVLVSVGLPGLEQKSSTLFYYRWEDFDPSWFVSDADCEALLPIPEELIGAFRLACVKAASAESDTSAWLAKQHSGAIDPNESITNAASAGVMAPIAKDAWYADRHAAIHNPAGHGEMVERAHNMLDRLSGHDVKWLGPTNVKDGADRVVDGSFIQVKYYNSARGTLNSAFDASTGKYRYLASDGSPMKLEVPKDQYEKVLEGFKDKIRRNEVPGVTDSECAKDIVCKGKLSYHQARNLTKAGTVESLTYDAATGAVVCSCAMGISFVFSAYSTYRQTGDMRKAVQAGMLTGTQVFGTTFVQHVLASQLSRTGLSDAIIGPSQVLVQKMGYKATQTIVNGLRALSGKSMLSGAAASSHLAKVLRGNVLTSVVTMAVLSVPETYRLVNRRISGSQYAKNMAVLAASIAAGAGGMVAAGVAAGKIASVAGTTVAPGVGTVVGAVGGFVGGAVGTLVAGTVGGILHEDDAVAMSRLLNALVSVMASEYLLDQKEMDAVVDALGKVSQHTLTDLFETVRSSDEQENVLRAFLAPIFDEVVSGREAFKLPIAQEIEEAVEDLAEEDGTEEAPESDGALPICIPEGWSPTDDFPQVSDDARGYVWDDEGTYAVMVVGSIEHDASLFVVDDVVSGVRFCLSDEQGLISAEHGMSARGVPYWETIVKMRLEAGVQYCMTIQLERADAVAALTVIAEENGVTGVRDSAVYNLAKDGGMIDGVDGGWLIDPIESSAVDRFPMNLSERESFDEMFPLHPLSELRSLAAFIKAQN